MTSSKHIFVAWIESRFYGIGKIKHIDRVGEYTQISVSVCGKVYTFRNHNNTRLVDAWNGKQWIHYSWIK